MISNLFNYLICNCKPNNNGAILKTIVNLEQNIDNIHWTPLTERNEDGISKGILQLEQNIDDNVWPSLDECNEAIDKYDKNKENKK